MLICSATIIYFSPTGTTKKILNAVLEGMGINNISIINLNAMNVRDGMSQKIENDIVLLGVPVYGTGIPPILLPFLNSLKGNNKPIVLITVYGNMSEGITLNEIDAILKNTSFHVVAAGSFIGEHSFSAEEIPIAKNRPNKEDLSIAQEFGKKIIEKMQKIEDINAISLALPQGNIPIMAKILPKNSAKLFAKTPTADMNLCNHCGVCVKLCPMDAIDKDTLEIEENKCLRCFCCVKKCPKKARQIILRPKIIASKVIKLKNKKNKDPKIYL